MNLLDLIRKARSQGKRFNKNSDNDLVIQTIQPGRRYQEILIEDMGTEGKDFKVVRNRSGQSVTFHPTDQE